jgi:probable blue pigment (indigoidine) exporter
VPITPQLRASFITLAAPAAWGSTYIVAGQLLPADPLYAALLRALPAGLILLALCRRLPTGIWWFRAAILGLLNFAVFFPLAFLAAFHLPGGVAATIQASSPVFVMVFAWALIRETSGWARVTASMVGLVGVAMLVLSGGNSVDAIGVLAAIGSVVASALGFVLIKRWPAPVDMVTLVSWQLVSGGLILLPIAVVVEGGPPLLDTGSLSGFLWIGSVGTVIAYLCWFHGLTRLPAGTVSLIGLVNPFVATVLGITIAGENFGPGTALGMVLVLGGVIAGQPAIARLLSRRRATSAPCCSEDLPTCSGIPAEGVGPRDSGPSGRRPDTPGAPNRLGATSANLSAQLVDSAGDRETTTREKARR